MSKFWMLYPVMISGSHATMYLDHAVSSSPSSWKEYTSTPGMDEHEFIVNTDLNSGSVEPYA